MEALEKVYELIDISSAREDEEISLQRSSTSLPKRTGITALYWKYRIRR